MPAKADAPLRKVTLNLYEADCVAMERHHGFGWTEQVRQLVHGHTSQFSRLAEINQEIGFQRGLGRSEANVQKSVKRTLGDLADDNQ